MLQKTEIVEAEEQWAMCLDILVEGTVGEIMLDMALREIHKANEESWTTVRMRSKGKAQKERTGLIADSSSEMYHRDTDIAQ